MVFEGSVTVEVLINTDSRSVPMTAGQFVMCRGPMADPSRWAGVVEMFYMPGTNEQSTAVDPRLDQSPLATHRMDSFGG